MNQPAAMPEERPLPLPARPGTDLATLVCRAVLATVFIYMGFAKALHPDVFQLNLYHYHLIHRPVLMNAIVAVLPWLEVVCGLCVLFGVGVRGSALLLLVMLLGFNGIVFHRAYGIAQAKHLAFCAVKFNCGCGLGEILACRKLTENFLMMLMAAWLLISPSRRWAVRFSLSGNEGQRSLGK